MVVVVTAAAFDSANAAPSAISDARAALSGSRFFVVVVMTVVTGGRVVVTGVFVVTVAAD